MEREGGLTTLCACMVCPVAKSSQFAVCSLNVGDSYGYIFSHNQGKGLWLVIHFSLMMVTSFLIYFYLCLTPCVNTTNQYQTVWIKFHCERSSVSSCLQIKSLRISYVQCIMQHLLKFGTKYFTCVDFAMKCCICVAFELDICSIVDFFFISSVVETVVHVVMYSFI